MSNRLYLHLRFVGVISLLLHQWLFAVAAGQGACYSAPQAAIDAVIKDSPSAPTLAGDGYRVTKIQSDPVLGRKWAMIANCRHPEWPVLVLPAPGAHSLKAPQQVERGLSQSSDAALLVRAGDLVRLWRQETFLRIEVAGVSEESGSLGKTIRVRLLHGNTDDQSIPQQFLGVVRGPSNVEIQP